MVYFDCCLPAVAFLQDHNSGTQPMHILSLMDHESDGSRNIVKCIVSGRGELSSLLGPSTES